MFYLNQVEGEGRLEVTLDGNTVRFVYWDEEGNLVSEFQTESPIDIEGLYTTIVLARNFKG